MENDNNNNESKRGRWANNDNASENERSTKTDEERGQRGEDRKASQAEREKATKALSQGYFPDGPGGKFTGV